MAELVIDDDVKCAKCGDPGAVAGIGICLKCAEVKLKKRWEREGKESINSKVINRICGLIRILMEEESRNLNRSFSNFAPDIFNIPFNVRLVQTRDGIGVNVETNYNGGPKRKASKESVVRPEQFDLFDIDIFSKDPVHDLDHIDAKTGEVFENEN